jgi:hypothetical protein
VIVVFDMGHEMFDELPVPESLERVEHLKMGVAVVDGSLALVPCHAIGLDGEVASNSVWVMKKYGVAESWTKLFDITVGEGGLVRVLGFKKNGEVLVVTNGYDHQLVCYEPSSGTIWNPHILSPTESFYLDTFVESLALLDVRDGVLGRRVVNNSSTSSKGKEKIN